MTLGRDVSRSTWITFQKALKIGQFTSYSIGEIIARSSGGNTPHA